MDIAQVIASDEKEVEEEKKRNEERHNKEADLVYMCTDKSEANGWRLGIKYGEKWAEWTAVVVTTINLPSLSLSVL